jgi:hypothetical protein
MKDETLKTDVRCCCCAAVQEGRHSFILVCRDSRPRLSRRAKLASLFPYNGSIAL